MGHPSLHDFACPLNSLHRSWMVMVILKTGHCGTTIRELGCEFSGFASHMFALPASVDSPVFCMTAAAGT